MNLKIILGKKPKEGENFTNYLQKRGNFSKIFGKKRIFDNFWKKNEDFLAVKNIFYKFLERNETFGNFDRSRDFLLFLEIKNQQFSKK